MMVGGVQAEEMEVVVISTTVKEGYQEPGGHGVKEPERLNC